MFKKIYIFLLLILVDISISTDALAQKDASSFASEKSTDSFWTYPTYIAATFPDVSINISSDIASAEKQWELIKGQNKIAEEARALLGLSDAYIAFGKEKKAYSYLGELLEKANYLNSETSVSHLYYNIAVVMSHLKQYPLAMLAYDQTRNILPNLNFKRKRRKFRLMDSVFHFSEKNEILTNMEFDEGKMEDRLNQAFFSIDTSKIETLLKVTESEPINIDTVLNAFCDDKKAHTYAIAIHIKQPKTGKKKIISHFTDVGHMFITLIKYNEDETFVSKTFGLYPKPGFLFNATPLFPKTEPLFKNDALHDWDEMLGKFVSAETFIKVLAYIDQTSNENYDLNNNNCSDFALNIASIAGISISNTKANWILGKGNSPAYTGQSILGAKFKNLETNSRDGLLVCTNNLFLSSK